jgi:hypothetical protein
MLMAISAFFSTSVKASDVSCATRIKPQRPQPCFNLLQPKGTMRGSALRFPAT